MYCHFRVGKKTNAPEIFKRNIYKLFPNDGRTVREAPKKKQNWKNSTIVVVQEVVESYRKQQEAQKVATIEPAVPQVPTAQVILEVGLDQHKRELGKHNEIMQYQRSHYSVKSLNPEVLRLASQLKRFLIQLLDMH